MDHDRKSQAAADDGVNTARVVLLAIFVGLLAIGVFLVITH